ncbi:MAG: SGNH/GDSL hydrolase family protein [Butyrivibrio sp.]|uniref:SGNH/GDSL hydrolase family protein n=1 Tax=Butyrivibrio sp. TaxID=28121 RepID=UPI0025DA6253|nr:SGNH/GDSL hydrolase family protein [Butyrivibrio sp.]MCR5773009.1 SGNH/GDSL hydrolase family protein [Butyrivibrio sp.]
MKKKLKALVPILTIASMIVGCSADTTLKNDTTGTITPTDAPTTDASESTSGSDASSNASSAASSESVSSSDASTLASTSSASSESSTESATNYDSSIPTVVFLGDDQFDLGRSGNTSIADYVESLLGTKANVINLGCTGVTATTALGTDNDTGMNFVNVAKFLNGEMDDTFFNNFPDAKSEAFIFDPADVDFYVVEYGINDFLQVKDLSNDVKTSDTTCYTNAIATGLGLLVQASPNAKIVLCSPVYSMFYAEDGSSLGSGHVYSNTFGKYMDYCAGCVQQSSLYDCISFDAFGDAYMNINDQTFSEYMQDDGIHLTRAGRNTFAAVVAHMINKQLGLDDTEIEIAYDIDDYKLDSEK